MSTEDFLPFLTQKSVEEDKGEIPLPPSSLLEDEKIKKSNYFFNKLKNKIQFIMEKAYHRKDEPYIHNRIKIFQFIDKYFDNYIQFIIDEIKFIYGTKNIYCSFLIMNSMVFYHELKISFTSTRTMTYLRRYIQDRIDICLRNDEGYGNVPNDNKSYLKDYLLDPRDFPLFSTIFDSTYGSLFADTTGRKQIHMLKNRERSPSPIRRRERSPSPIRRRERSPSPIRRRERSPLPIRRRERSPSHIRRRERSPSPIRRRERSPVSYRERERSTRERSWSRERSRRDYSGEKKKEDDDIMIRMLMEQNEKLMKMVSNGAPVQQPQPVVSYAPLMAPPIHYQQRPSTPYYHPPPPPPPPYQQLPTQYQQYSMPYSDRR
jgi:hypothetical protein